LKPWVIIVIVIVAIVVVWLIADIILCICCKTGLFHLIKEKCCPKYSSIEDPNDGQKNGASVSYGTLKEEE